MSAAYRNAVAPEVYDAVLGAVLTAIKRLDLRYTYGAPEEGGRYGADGRSRGRCLARLAVVCSWLIFYYAVSTTWGLFCIMVYFVLRFFCFACHVGCVPRGETESLDDLIPCPNPNHCPDSIYTSPQASSLLWIGLVHPEKSAATLTTANPESKPGLRTS